PSVAMRYSEFSPAGGLDGAGAGRPFSSSLSSFHAGRGVAAGVPLRPSSFSLLRAARVGDRFWVWEEMLSGRPALGDPPRRRPPAGALVPTYTLSRVTWIERTSVCAA